jgi:hypothetical protein
MKQHTYKKKTHKKKFNTDLCDDKLTFQECELAILRHAVDETEEKQKKKIVNNGEVKKMLTIVENFLRKRKLICYGGTAINDILPKHSQFYNRDVEIPDYDFYSSNALEDAKELANIFYKEGYEEVEAKSGVHVGTYKVFVNFIPIADITLLNKQLYKQFFKDSIKINGIYYSPPNVLRMNMFLELSRPAGDVSRWEKVLKRLTLLNEFYPLKPEHDCHTIDFQREMDSNNDESEKLYLIVRDSFINQGVIFFGGYATSLYSKYMNVEEQDFIKKIPDFDVISEEPEKTVTLLKETLSRENVHNIKTIKHKEIGEIIPEHIEIKVGEETIAFIYKPIACHSYNTIHIGGKDIKIATIDTILSFYLAFIYANEHYYNKDRLLCMAKFLFDVEQKNRLEQKGLLKRFSIDCYGKQATMEDLRSEKAKKFKELMNNKNSKEYEVWFLKYNPREVKIRGTNETPGHPLPSTKKRENISKKTRTRKNVEKKKTSDYLF